MSAFIESDWLVIFAMFVALGWAALYYAIGQYGKGKK